MEPVETPFQFDRREDAEEFKDDLREVLEDMSLVVMDISINSILPESLDHVEQEFRDGVRDLMLASGDFEEQHYMPHENPDKPKRPKPESRYNLAFEVDEAVEEFMVVAGKDDDHRSAGLIYNDFRYDYDSRESVKIMAYSNLAVGAEVLRGLKRDCPTDTGYTVEVTVEDTSVVSQPEALVKPLIEFSGRMYTARGIELEDVKTVPEDIHDRIELVEYVTNSATSNLPDGE